MFGHELLITCVFVVSAAAVSVKHAGAVTVNDAVASLCPDAQNTLTTTGQFNTLQAILGVIGDADISTWFLGDVSFDIVESV